MAFRLAGNPRAAQADDALKLHYLTRTAQPDESIFVFGEALGSPDVNGYLEVSAPVSSWALGKTTVNESCD